MNINMNFKYVVIKIQSFLRKRKGLLWVVVLVWFNGPWLLDSVAAMVRYIMVEKIWCSRIAHFMMARKQSEQEKSNEERAEDQL